LALEHVDARTKKVGPAVEFSFQQGNQKFGDSRAVKQQGTVRTAAADRVLAKYAVPFISHGIPSDLVAMVLLLCSDNASYVTGQVISVSGGYAM